MTLRHAAHKATLDRGYASEWNDDHVIDPTDEILFWTTFVEEAITVMWDIGEITGGGTVTITLTDDHAFLNCISGAGVGDIASLRKELGGAVGNITDPDDLPIMTAAVRLVSPAGAGLTHEFGLFDSATAPFTALQEGAYFRVEANVLYAVTGTGAAETTTALGAPNEYGVYRIKILSTSVRFYADDMESAAATHTLTLPTGNLTMKLSTIGVAAGSQILRSDFCGLIRLRKQ